MKQSFTGGCPICRLAVIMKKAKGSIGHEWSGICAAGEHAVVLRASKSEKIAAAPASEPIRISEIKKKKAREPNDN